MVAITWTERELCSGLDGRVSRGLAGRNHWNAQLAGTSAPVADDGRRLCGVELLYSDCLSFLSRLPKIIVALHIKPAFRRGLRRCTDPKGHLRA